MAADPEPLDLGALLAEADAANPEILSAHARLQAAEHVPSQRETLPDPLAAVAYTNETLDALTLGSAADSGVELSFSQEVPYPGKRRLAGDVARAEIEVGERGLALARLRLRAEVKVAYSELVRLGRTIAIVRDSRKLLESFRDSARARYESGQGILENVLKAQTELTRLDAQLETLEQERRSAGAALGRLLGRRTAAVAGAAIVPPRTRLPDPEALEQAALENSPPLAALRAAARLDDRRLDLARREQKPDFVWGTSYVHRGGLDPMVSGSFGIRLPLYGKRKQVEAIAERRYELEAAEHDVDARTGQVAAELRDLLARAERARTLARLYREGILPQARSTLEAAAASYAVGQAEFITLLDDFGRWLGYEVDLELLRAENVRALSALEPLTGFELVTPGTAADAAGGDDE